MKQILLQKRVPGKGTAALYAGLAQELGWSVGGWGAPVAITTSAHQFRPDTNHRSYTNN